MPTIVKQMRMWLNRAFAKSLLLFASKNNKKKLHKQMFANDATMWIKEIPQRKFTKVSFCQIVRFRKPNA